MLWQQRQLVDRLLYRMVVARLLLSSGQDRFVEDALTEIDGVVADLLDADRARAAAVDQVAGQLQVRPAELTLPRLIDHATGAVREALLDHQQALTRAVGEIERVSEDNRQLVSSGLQSVRRQLATAVGEPTDGPALYDASGQQRPHRGSHARFDRPL